MPGSISFGPMTERDLDEVAGLEKECFSLPWSRDAFKNTLTDDNYIFFVARDDGNVVGTAGLIVCGDEADVTNVAVKSDMRKNGIAFNLLSKLLEYAKEKNINTFTLEVRKSNEGAIGLYEKLGFKCLGERPGFYDCPKEDALIYRKTDGIK